MGAKLEGLGCDVGGVGCDVGGGGVQYTSLVGCRLPPLDVCQVLTIDVYDDTLKNFKYPSYFDL